MNPLFLSTLLLSSALCTFSSVDELSQDVSPTQFGAFNFSELEQTLYDVELLKVPLPESALETVRQEQDTEHQFIGSDYTILVSKHGQRYACELPWKPPSDDQEKEPEKPEMLNVTAILLPLLNRPCTVKTVGWWTYEYCHRHFVRQYHMEGGKITGKIIHLGFYENETVWDKEHIDKVQNVVESMKDSVEAGPFPVTYHQVNFVNGTTCDHTGEPRTTKVMLRCSLTSDDKLYEVIERETCSYTLIVHTALLCGHPLFDTGNRGRTRTLSCSPLLSQTDYQKYQESLETEREELSTGTGDPKLQEGDRKKQTGDPDLFSGSTDSKDQALRVQQDSTGEEPPEGSASHASEKAANVKEKAAGEEVVKSTSPKGPPIEDKDKLVSEIEKNIEVLYKQLLSSLDNQKDPTATKLKEAIEGKYTEFESLKKQNAMQKEIEKMLTDDEKNFRKKEPVIRPKKTEGSGDSENKAKTTPASEEEDTADSEGGKERPVVEPYEVQGVSTGPSGGREMLESEELLSEETMAEIQEVLNEQIQEQLRESGLEGLADVKVVAMPLSMMEMLMEDEEKGDSDEDQEESTIKMVLKLDDVGQTQDKLSQLFGSFFGTSTVQQQSVVSPEQQRVKDLEEGYNQVWEEQSKSNKKRTGHMD